MFTKSNKYESNKYVCIFEDTKKCIYLCVCDSIYKIGFPLGLRIFLSLERKT